PNSVNDNGPAVIHPVPASFVKVGPEQPISRAFSIVVSHSFCVGSRQSPGEDPSVNMQSPFFSPATAFLAASKSPEGKQLDFFNKTNPARLSVTVPFPHSAKRLVLSPHEPARPAPAPPGV